MCLRAWLRFGGEFADCSLWQSIGADVDQTQTGGGLAIGIREVLAKELIASTYREYHCAGVGRRLDRAV